MEIDAADALSRLDAATAEDLDRESLGVVRLDTDGRVVAYNASEAARSGISSGKVIGRLFFIDVAPCTNNHLVGDRFREEPELDVTLDYLFTLRMKPTPVRLRLLKSAAATFMYLLIMAGPVSEDLARDHESLLQFVYQFPVAVLRIGGTGEIDLLTPRLAALLQGLGLPIDPASGWGVLAALDGAVAEQARAAMSSPGAVVMQRPVDFRDPRGRMHHLSLSVLITGVDACMVAIEDVTKRVEQERQLTIQRHNLAVVLESIEGYLVASLDLDLRVIQANRSIERMLGLGTEVVGRPWAELFARHGADAPDLRALADEALRQGWSTFEAEYVAADGATLWCDTSLTTVVDESGGASQFVAVVRDVSARRRRELALLEQAQSDPLTGLLNRRGLATHLRSWRDAADPARPATLTAIALDLDFFRQVNEAHGHDGGDEVLRALSRTISQQFRREDLVARLGGEEFVVILRDLSDELASALTERLRQRVAGTLVRWRGASIAVTASLGVATRDLSGDVEALLRDADLALYRAKAEGRNRVARG